MIVTKDQLKGQVIEGRVPPNMKNRYTLRCIAPDYTLSRAQNPKVVLECEIVKPDQFAVDGDTYDLSSLKVQVHLPIQVFDNGVLDEKKTKNVQRRYGELRERLGLPFEFDLENKASCKDFEGLVFDAIISSRENIAQRQDETGKYINIKDDAGKDISQGWQINFVNAEDILSRSTLEVNRPY